VLRKGGFLATTTVSYPLRFKDKASADHVADAVAWANSYQETIPGPNGEEIANPQTKLEFAMGVIKSFLTTKVEAYNDYLASQNAPSQPTDIGVI
jgi:hypothetical protein